MYRSYFLRLLTSSLLMILMLITSTHFMIRYSLLRDVKGELRAQDEEMLLLIQHQMDSQLAVLQTLSQTIGLNSLFSKYRFLEQAYRSMQGIDNLKGIVAANTLVQIVGLCYEDDEFLISNVGSFRKDRFLRYMNLPEDFFTDERRRSIGYMTTAGHLVFTYPLPLAGPPKGFSFFFVDRVLLRRMILPASPRFSNRSLIVAGGDDEVLISNMTTDQTVTEPSTMIVTEFTSTQTGLHYLAITPPEHFEALVKAFGSKVLLFMLFLTAVGLSIAVLVTRFNYAPIRSLVAKLRVQGVPSRRRRSEVKEIDRILSGLLPYTEHPELLQQAERANRRKRLADAVLKGYPEGWDRLRAEAETVQWRLPYTFLGIGIARFDNELPESATVASYVGDGYVCHPLLRLDLSRQMAFLINTRNRHAGWNEFEDLQNQLRRVGGGPITIGISSFTDEPSGLGRCYLEGVTALDYRFVAGTNRVIMHRVLPDPDHEELGDTQWAIEQIRLNLRNCKVDNLKQSIEELIQRCHRLPLSAARYVYWEVIHTIREFAQSLSGADEHAENLIPHIQLLTQFESMEELSEFLSEWSQKVQDYLMERNSNERSIMVNQVKYFINRNYSRIDLSIQSLADHFEISQGYLCRLYKAVEHSTILTYISEVRLDAARRLLTETTSTVKEIATMVGFIDSASFIRKFKKSVGVPPGEYRSIHGGQT